MQVEDVRRQLADGGVLPAGQVDEQVTRWQSQGGSPDDAEGFLAALVEQGHLSHFQRKALLAGLEPPYTIGPYRVTQRISVGRLGSSFRAVQEEFDQPVSLKLFPAALQEDPERAKRLSREMRVAIQVDDPNVVRTFQVARMGGYVMLVQEKLEGETLEDRLERDGKLPVLEACRIARHVALGLAHLHERDIVHRDVQPKNVWLHGDGRVLLTEFAAATDALAYLDEEEADEEGGFHFTEDAVANYDYLSAEQGVDEQFADARSDVYSLGCVLYHCLTGEPVFPDANPVRKMLRHALTEAPSARDVDPAIPHEAADVVTTMLAKEPDDRFQKAADAAYALEQVMAADVERAISIDEVNPDFLEWARETSQDEESVVATVVGDPQFFDFLEFLTVEDDEDEETGEK